MHKNYIKMCNGKEFFFIPTYYSVQIYVAMRMVKYRWTRRPHVMVEFSDIECV